MTRTTGRWTTRLATIAVLIPCLAQAAPRPTELPPLELRTLDDAPAAETAYLRDGKWLLVYVGAHADQSRALLQVLETTKARVPVVIVINSKMEDARRFATAYQQRVQGAWLLDPESSILRGLDLQAVPVVLGLDHRTIRWTLTGALPNHRTLRSILASW